MTAELYSVTSENREISILVDTSARGNVVGLKSLKKVLKKFKSNVSKTANILRSFSGHSTWPLGYTVLHGNINKPMGPMKFQVVQQKQKQSLVLKY